MKFRILIIAIFLFGIVACSTNDDDNSTTCDQVTILSSEQYANAPQDQLSITSLEIHDNCLKINFESSGCSGDTWVVKLIDSEEILISEPGQRNLILSLMNEELCDAIIRKEMTFDISNLQVGGNSEILNITNTDDEILYTY